MSQAGTIHPNQSVLNLQQAFKLALSMTLLYWFVLWIDWDMPRYGGLAIVLISLDTTGASLLKGILRILGTTFGLAIGMLGLSLFGQNEIFSLLYYSIYVVFVGYFMQYSRYPYAWYVAGFLPTLIWATTYGDVNNAFHYTVFRYLETAVGIVIFTLVSMIIWPRNAGGQLNEEGKALWRGFNQLFKLYSQQLVKQESTSVATELRAKLAGMIARAESVLLAAYTDTPSIKSKKREWEAFRVNARALNDAMELWHQCLQDCQQFDLNKVLPRFPQVMERIERRLKLMQSLWELRSDGKHIIFSDADEQLLENLDLNFSSEQLASLSHSDHASLVNFREQMKFLELTTRELLLTMFQLSGKYAFSKTHSKVLLKEYYKPSIWDPARLINSLFPAICFIIAFFFWIFFDPPTGPNIPSMAVTCGLIILLNPFNAQSLLLPVLFAICGIVAPIYFLLMPQLSTGTELLVFIFCFTFGIAIFFTGRLSVLGTLILVLFVQMTGISNQQNYSFVGVVDGALLMSLSLAVVAIVQGLFQPLRPEQMLLKTIRQFCYGCAGIINEFSLTDMTDYARQRRHRKRVYESLVLNAPAKILDIKRKLNFKLFPDNPQSKVQKLSDGFQDIAFRLQALEFAYSRLATHSCTIPDSIKPVIYQILGLLKSVFEHWGDFEPVDQFEGQLTEVSCLNQQIEQRFNELLNESGQSQTGDSIDAELYAIVGTIRGLKESMASVQVVINEINWSQWSRVRF